jgi:hypothetical protein
LALSDSTELKNSKNWLVLLLSLIAIFAHKAAIRINVLIFIYLNSVVNSHSESADAHEGTGEHGGETDELYDKSVQIVTSTRRASISSLQRCYCH